MRGVILAGGHGTRLMPLTRVTNKHLLPVYDKPMIYYPIETLKKMGIEDILLVSGGEHIGGFAELLGDGSELGVRLTYKVQKEADGIAGALLLAEDFVSNLFVVILGDNYFQRPQEIPERPAIWVDMLEDPSRFGVYLQEMGRIIEKPKKGEYDNREVVTGLYAYNDDVFDFIRTLGFSERGELEITDVNNWILENGADVKYVSGYWSDMGTFDSIQDTVTTIKAVEGLENEDRPL